eukprot:jgi/Ulvmu1/810/UM010_0184.1
MAGPVGTAPTTYKEYDASHIRPAGALFPAADSASSCLTWSSRPQTPGEIAKYRQSRLHEPGQIYRHFGAASDPVDTNKVYGRESNKEETLEKVFKTYPESDMMRWTLDRSEDVYHSNTREPLGKSWNRGHSIPSHLGTDVPFGHRINAKQNSAVSLARSALAPVDREHEDSDEPGTAAHVLYVRTHGAYAPGEQRRRPYDWAATGINPAAHRFGAVEKSHTVNGVGKALNPDLGEAGPPGAQIVNRRVEEHRLVNGEVLGQPRRLGAGDRGLPADFTFGKPSLPKGGKEDGVGDLLHGAYTVEQQQPDADLGKSLREGFRNVLPAAADGSIDAGSGVGGRIFGVPSVRTDLHPPTRASIANAQNFGAEPDAAALLSPCSTADRGVNEEHYTLRRDAASVRGLLGGAGITMADDEFSACFSEAASAEGGGGKVSLMSFMETRHRMLHERAGLA